MTHYQNRPRQLSNPGADLKGIFVVRTPEDANAVAAAAAGKRVAIIGTSFIGNFTYFMCYVIPC